MYIANSKNRVLKRNVKLAIIIHILNIYLSNILAMLTVVFGGYFPDNNFFNKTDTHY